MNHIYLNGTCCLCGAEQSAPQACVDETSAKSRKALELSVLLAMVEHGYTHNSDIPWHTIAAYVSHQVTQEVYDIATGRRVGLDITLRSPNGTILSSEHVLSKPSEIAQVLSAFMSSVEPSYTLTVKVIGADNSADHLIKHSFQRALMASGMRSDRRAEATAKRIGEILREWKQSRTIVPKVRGPNWEPPDNLPPAAV